MNFKFNKGVHTVIFFWHDRPRVGGPTCSTPPGGHYKTKKNSGLYGFFVAQPFFCWPKKNCRYEISYRELVIIRSSRCVSIKLLNEIELKNKSWLIICIIQKIAKIRTSDLKQVPVSMVYQIRYPYKYVHGSSLKWTVRGGSTGLFKGTKVVGHVWN